MLKGFVLAAYCVVGLFASTAAHSQVFNTYAFTQGGYMFNTGPSTLSGSFTAQINSLGHVNASDLTDFSMSFGPQTGTDLSEVELFSFNSDRVSDLAIITLKSYGVRYCVGLPATFSPNCNPGGTNPANTFGFYGFNGAGLYALSDQAPVISLVKSVTITPPSGPQPSAVPEPATWMMMIAGFALLAWSLRRSLPVVASSVGGSRHQRQGRADPPCSPFMG